MKAVLNLVSLAALGALGAGIYLTQGQAESGPAVEEPSDTIIIEDGVVQDDAMDAAPDVADEPSAPDTDAGARGEHYTVEGTLPGYFVANGDVMFGTLALTSIMVEPNWNGFEERLLMALEDTSQVAGSNDYGDFYQAYPLQVDSWSVTPDGVSIEAHHAELGAFSLTGHYDPDGYAQWTSGESAVGELLIADISLDGQVQENVSLAFWVGD